MALVSEEGVLLRQMQRLVLISQWSEPTVSTQWGKLTLVVGHCQGGKQRVNDTHANMTPSSNDTRSSASDQYWLGVVFSVWIRDLDSIWNF